MADVADPSPLLEPLTLGAATAPNRVVFGPHETNLGRRRSLSDRHVAYYRRRAEGGAGIIVTEEASVHDSDHPYERAPLAADAEQGWAEVVGACAPSGTLVLAAIGHAGGQGTSHWNQRELWAPSRVPEVNSREVPKWMEPDDIHAVLDGFADAARRAVRAGCAGVDVNAGQYSLIRQFLSGLTNQRDDEWGERPRFLTEVLRHVRDAVGAEGVVGLRLSCDELAPWAGITPEESPGLAAAIAADDGAARIDLLTVVRGSIYSVAATRPDGHTPPGFNLELSRSVRDAVASASGGRVGVIAQGSIVDVAQAERALRDGCADAVEMTRAQISDADLVAKLAAGTPERIRPCTLSNQRSQVRDNRNPIVSALGDPRAGHETEDPPLEGSAAHPVDLTVVGGGPAGLEAARVAAIRGHRVRLFGAAPQLGGVVRTAAKGPGWERLGLLVDWLEGECRRLGVELRTGERAEPADLSDTGGHLIIATGARPGRRDYTATRAAVVHDAPDVLDDPALVGGGAVAVWDPVGGPVAVAVAELLAGSGTSVQLITPDNIVGNELARSGDLAPANARLQQAGVELHRRSVLRSVKKGVAVVEDRFTAVRRELAVASVVDAGHRLPDEELWDALCDHPDLHVQRAGDCVAPRSIHEAILEGRRTAMALG